MSVYNGEEYLAESIESILGQTFGDFEFLVVDDGSTDGSSDILQSFDDPRLAVIRQANNGYVPAWERAIGQSRAPLIARMDADDISRPARLETQVRRFDCERGLALLGTGGVQIDEAGRYLRSYQIPRSDFALRLALLSFNPFVHGSVMFRRRAFIGVGGYRAAYCPAEDYDLWARMAVAGFRIANVDEDLYCHRIHQSSVSAMRQESQTNATRVVRREVEAQLRPQVLRPMAIRQASGGIRRSPDPRVAAEWPWIVKRLEHEIAQDLRSDTDITRMVRAVITLLRVSPREAIAAALRTVAERVRQSRCT